MVLSLHCHGCGAHYQRPQLQAGDCARCSRCGTVLETFSAMTPSAWFALLVTAVIALAFANIFPVAILGFQGLKQSAGFFDAVRVTWSTGYEPVAVLTFAVGFFFPLLHVFTLLWIFVPLTFNRVPAHIELALRFVDHLRHWCMVPVLLTGILVASVKMADLASLTPEVGFFALAFATILLTFIGRLDSQNIYLMMVDMGLSVAPQKPIKPPSPEVISRTWALLSAAAVLYIPANVLPIMLITGVQGESSHTIMGGVIELCEVGAWDIAAVVFTASMVVPVFKLAAMTLLLWRAQKGHPEQVQQRTRLYVAVELIGQWSMIDVFVVILLSALVRFGSLMSIEPSAGAAAFGGVVVLTMLAAIGFDPRLAWRRAGHRSFLK